MQTSNHFSFPRHFAVLALASAIAVPVWAQQSQPSNADSQQSQPAANDSQSVPSSAAQQPSPTFTQPLSQPKEGFWGRVNPFASKKWVKRSTDPINDRLTELDSVNAHNAQDIKDVDARAQAGILKAQNSADAADQTANTANQQALNANNTAQQASGHVDHLNSTVNGLDQYKQVTDVEIRFRSGSPVLNSDARTKLDQLATTLTGHNGYIVEMEAHSPATGGTGIQYSQRMAEAIERYLVTEHQVPVYRMHYVALGNAQVAATGDQQDQKPVRVRTSTVHVMLMENSLAAQADASPQSAPAAAGTEQP
jgi:outer membrane protein OmpA-like peptidoglycan-associated protein